MASPPDDRAAIDAYNRRLGLGLFALYSSTYAVFMALSAFKPEIMALRPWGGINVAVGYGFALIFGAFLLAAIYLGLAKRAGSP